MQRTKQKKNHGTAEGSIAKVFTRLQNSRFNPRRDRKVRREIKDRLFRFFIYLAEEYQKLVKQAERSLYGTTQIMLPTPQCVVFYNGEKEIPEEQILKLSDAFENKEREADVELKVRMLNVNYGHNKELMQKCRTLKEYAEFIEISRQFVAKEKDQNEALNKAIDYCIDHDILADFLRKYRGEVLGMLLEEFDAQKYERTLREEGFQEGRLEGQKEGFEEGDARRLIHSVEEIRKKMNIPLAEACALLGITVEEYEEAKKRTTI